MATSNGGAQRSTLLQVQATSAADLRTWDVYVTQRQRSGELSVRSVEVDPLLPSRTTERLQQFHEGVPIWGAEVVRDSDRGLPLSFFGVLSPQLTLSVNPTLSLEQADQALRSMGGADAALTAGAPRLVVAPLDDGEHRLAYTAVVSSGQQVFRAFVDAHTGNELLRFSELHTQQVVGTGRGVLGDLKKLSVRPSAAGFLALDTHRPPVIGTFDMRRNLARADAIVRLGAPLFASDQAVDSDNDWGDPAVVDAHVHVSWTYDYFFKRFGRHGLDDREAPMFVLTNALSQQDALSYAPSSSVAETFVLNAFWCSPCGPGGAGLLYFGNGIPAGFSYPATGQNITYLAGSLDIVAHELTHAVTDFSSRLIYRNESGALNEAFSDIMGTSAEFFYHPTGTGPGTADYLLGEDSFRVAAPGSRPGSRSLENPLLYGQPDHYSRRFLGSADEGGIHTNSGIANHAFYLAIEGGVNRTSGSTVQGVGAANREQIEKAFYRGFVSLLPPNATFSIARATTVQAARDLYGAGSAAERAITQAWTAVGVF